MPGASCGVSCELRARQYCGAVTDLPCCECEEDLRKGGASYARDYLTVSERIKVDRAASKQGMLYPQPRRLRSSNCLYCTDCLLGFLLDLLAVHGSHRLPRSVAGTDPGTARKPRCSTCMPVEKKNEEEKKGRREKKKKSEKKGDPSMHHRASLAINTASNRGKPQRSCVL